MFVFRIHILCACALSGANPHADRGETTTRPAWLAPPRPPLLCCGRSCRPAPDELEALKGEARIFPEGGEGPSAPQQPRQRTLGLLRVA